jgi:hypothetical protein
VRSHLEGKDSLKYVDNQDEGLKVRAAMLAESTIHYNVISRSQNQSEAEPTMARAEDNPLAPLRGLVVAVALGAVLWGGIIVGGYALWSHLR